MTMRAAPQVQGAETLATDLIAIVPFLATRTVTVRTFASTVIKTLFAVTVTITVTVDSSTLTIVSLETHLGLLIYPFSPLVPKLSGVVVAEISEVLQNVLSDDAPIFWTYVMIEDRAIGIC
jgi:hypothetical protein